MPSPATINLITVRQRLSGERMARYEADTGDLRCAQARTRVLYHRHQVTPSRLVSELTFGFWRYLLAARYETTLWTPALRHAFPHLASQRRSDVARPVERLHHLRNRVAHYEPIYPRRLDLDHRDAFDVVAAICGDSRLWLEQTSLVSGTLSRRP